MLERMTCKEKEVAERKTRNNSKREQYKVRKTSDRTKPSSVHLNEHVQDAAEVAM